MLLHNDRQNLHINNRMYSCKFIDEKINKKIKMKTNNSTKTKLVT